MTSKYKNLVRVDDGEEDTDSESHWSYEGGEGPANWDIHYPQCGGTSQSPIDIEYSGASLRREIIPLQMSGYGTVSQHSELINNGHTVQLNMDHLTRTEGLLRGGQLEGEYQIKQLHFHWGSEHTVDGAMFHMELHLVHTRVREPNPLETPKGLAVAGFFFEMTEEDNPALTPLTEAFSKIKMPNTSVDFNYDNFSLVELLKPVAPIDGSPRSSPYSTYQGSLTTPPCSQIVEWINFLTPLQISGKQLGKFMKLRNDKKRKMVDNFRPPQPLHGRTVKIWN